MLTDEQKRDLETRNDEDISSRKRADIVHRFTGKLKDRLNGLEDINYLLSELPASSIANSVSSEHLSSALKLAEKLMEIIDPIGIIEATSKNPKYVREYLIKDVKGLRGMMYYPDGQRKSKTNNLQKVKVSFPATQEEIEISQKIRNHKKEVDHFSNQFKTTKNEVYTLYEFSKMINEIAKKRGQVYQIETIFSSAEVISDDPKPGEFADLPEINDAIVNFIKKENQETRS